MTPQSFMLPLRSRDAFWHAVEDCLIHFHNRPPTDAKSMVEGFRVGIDAASVEFGVAGGRSEVFYHSEPFDVACDLARSQLTLDPNLQPAYQAILQRYNW